MTTERPTADVLKTPVVVDYTNRDFYSLRDELIARVKDRVADWYGDDPADFGVALIEAFAYMGDITSYYIDRIANEATLLTATQRESVINLARSYGYNPAGYQTATTTVRFTNTSGASITIPAGSEVSGTVIEGDSVRQVIFTTSADAVVAANSNVSVEAFHGENVAVLNPANPLLVGDIAGEQVGFSDGSPNQEFKLSENQVVDGTIQVYVQNGDSYGAWDYTLHLTDYGPNDAVYTTYTDADNYVYIVFGDGVSGVIAPNASLIKVRYVVGGGVLGNIPLNTLTSLYYVPGLTSSQVSALTQDISVTNTALGAGGLEPESIETIKELAPQAFSALNRAVTLDDFASLALQTYSVGKARAVGQSGNSVTLYVSPRRTDTETDPYPLYDNTNTTLTVEWTGTGGLKADVVSALADKTLIGTSLTVLPPVYVPVTISIQYSKQPQYTTTQVESEIRTLLNAYYSYQYVSFGQIIYPEELEFLLRYTPGVTNVRVTELYRTGDAAGRDVLVASNEELFSIVASGATSGITVTADSTDADLSTLATNVGTLIPTFTAEFYSYGITVSGGTSAVQLTPTAVDTTGTVISVTVGSSTISKTGSYYSIPTPTTTTTTVVAVLAEDKVTRKTYTVTITKA